MSYYKNRQPADNLRYEKTLWTKGVELIAGVDEVGRGALAGPMVVGAVILKVDDLKQLTDYVDRANQNDQSIIHTNNDIASHNPQIDQKYQMYQQITDSKLLSPKKREELSDFIIQNCLCYSVFQIDNKQIDAHGISPCTQKAFTGVVKSLKTSPEHILTDAFGIKTFPQVVQTNITSGDKLSITISAASIVAKVFRDKLMCDLATLPEYAMYGFAKHKGYGTRLHMDKIAQHGISNIHRRTFIH
jgi:ribonuclease HII